MLHFTQIDPNQIEDVSFAGEGTTTGAWVGFSQGPWCENIDVRDFILRNYTPYDRDGSFLSGPVETTEKLWNKVKTLLKAERDNGGVLDADTSIPSDLISHGAGYIDRDLETIVGLQTDAPLKRAIMPTGGVRMVAAGLSRLLPRRIFGKRVIELHHVRLGR